MKELMTEIKNRYFNELSEGGHTTITTELAQELYAKICEEVYLEKLSQIMERNN